MEEDDLYLNLRLYKKEQEIKKQSLIMQQIDATLKLHCSEVLPFGIRYNHSTGYEFTNKNIYCLN